MTELATTYLGLQLRSPIVASAGPLTGTVDGARAAAQHGAGAIVLPSLFEEDLVHDSVGLHHMLEASAGAHPEAAAGYFHELHDYEDGLHRYLRLLEGIRASVQVPVIASLNGMTPGGWTSHAKQLEDAGADALELNIYEVAADPSLTGAALEDHHVDLVTRVRAATTLPVAVKLGPYYSAFANFAGRVVAAGADGLVLFNRFYQPDIDIRDRSVHARMVLSTSEDLRLPLRWIALLHGRLACSLAATSGVHTAADVAKALLAGADVAMTTAALLRHGPAHVSILERDLREWMAEEDFESVDQLRGSAGHLRGADPVAFERANYLATIRSWPG